MSPLTTKQAEEAREIGREIAEQLTPPHGTTLIQTQAEPKRDRGALVGAVIALALASVGAIAWASVSGQRAEEAYTMARADHDTITEIKTLIPRLESAVSRLEKQVDAKGAK